MKRDLRRRNIEGVAAIGGDRDVAPNLTSLSRQTSCEYSRNLQRVHTMLPLYALCSYSSH